MTLIFNTAALILFFFTESDISKEEVKKNILCLDPCKSLGPYPKDPVTKRSFSSDFYFTKTKTGQKIERFWLCYSQKLNGVYCEPCWLFSDRNDPHFKDAWCKGTINDWQGLSKKIKEHEISQIHINSCLAYSMGKNKKDVRSMLKQDFAKWHQILKRILDVIVTISTCGFAFRGHRNEVTKNITSKSGNFLNIVELLSRYDPLLKSHLENDQNKTTYLSPVVQNEMIHLASKHVLSDIIREVQEAPFFSLILDTTQDISRTDQMSIIIRHVLVNQSEDVFEIRESFMSFIALTKQNAEEMEDKVCTFLKNSHIDITKCRGQGYDGASVMSGKYTGLQSRIKQKSNNAEYLHCAAHNLNLVLNDSVNDIAEIIIFFDLINQIYVYFSESLPRWQSLKESSCIIQKTLKRLCPTRWSSRFDCLLAVKINFTSILNCLSKIILTSTKTGEIVEATGLRKQMSSFHFVLMLVFQCKVLERINITSKILQKENTTLDEATNLLEKSFNKLKEMRNEFQDIVEEAKEIAKSWKIETTLSSRRRKKVKRFYDELSEDFLFADPLHSFRVKVFNKAIDTLISQVQRRFESMKNVNDNFSFLTPTYLVEKTDKELTESALKFYEKYNTDVSSAIGSEVICFRNVVSSEITKRKMKSVKDVAKYLFIENKMLASSLPDLCTAMTLFLTLPVTSATAERSFSKLKLIKNYLRNSMSATRLNSLAILSVESERARALNLDKLIEEFCSSKKRRGLFNL